jgi:septum formation protein
VTVSGAHGPAPIVVLPPDTRLVLASASPRRAALLESVHLGFEVRPPDIDESPLDGEDPVAYVRRLSQEKAAAVVGPDDRSGVIVLAADTTVALGRVILGKPDDDDAARDMLRRLSGRTHQVLTGVTLHSDDDVSTIAVSTDVRFAPLDDAVVEWYVALGEGADKAGGYALQGAGAALVERIDGSVSNVIGLPLAETIGLLHSASPVR